MGDMTGHHYSRTGELGLLHMSAPSSPLRQTLKLMQASSTAGPGPMYAPLQQTTALGVEQRKHGIYEGLKPTDLYRLLAFVLSGDAALASASMMTALSGIGRRCVLHFLILLTDFESMREENKFMSFRLVSRPTRPCAIITHGS